MSSPKPRRVSQAPKVTFRTLNLAEAYREFGLERDEIYAAVARGEVHAVERPPRDRRSLKGQLEYPEWELKKLTEALGLTLVHREVATVKFRYLRRSQKALPIAA